MFFTPAIQHRLCSGDGGLCVVCSNDGVCRLNPRIHTKILWLTSFCSKHVRLMGLVCGVYFTNTVDLFRLYLCEHAVLAERGFGFDTAT